MARRYVVRNLDAVLKEMHKAAPRAAILTGVSLVEYLLENLLASALRAPASADERDKLFAQSGPMPSLSAKIWMAYFMRVIGPATRRELDILRALRNECAHDMNPIRFDQARIANRCRSLKQQRTNPHATSDAPKAIFIATVGGLSARMIGRTMRNKGRPSGELRALSLIEQSLDD